MIVPSFVIEWHAPGQFLAPNVSALPFDDSRYPVLTWRYCALSQCDFADYGTETFAVALESDDSELNQGLSWSAYLLQFNGMGIIGQYKSRGQAMYACRVFAHCGRLPQ